MSGICDPQGKKLLVQYSLDVDKSYDDATHTWVDVSADSGMLDVSGGDKQASEYRTHGGLEVAVQAISGMRNIQLDVVWRNSESSFLELLTSKWDGTTTEPCLWIRWAYASGASGALRRTAKCQLLTNPFTGGDPNSAEVLRKSLTFVTATIHRDTVA